MFENLFENMEGRDGQTEKATPKRRNEERKKGNLPVSQEIKTVFVLLCGVIVLRFAIPVILKYMVFLNTEIFRFPEMGEWSPSTVQAGFFKGLLFLGVVITPVFIAAIVGAMMGSLCQTGFYFSMEAIKMKWSALNPVAGLKNLFSPKSIINLGLSTLKIIVIGGTLYILTKSRVKELTTLPYMTLPLIAEWMFKLIFKITVWVMIIYIVIAIIDWIQKKYAHEKQLLMTKQEVKEERKQQEPSPVIKKQQQKKMRELTMARMMGEVPKSTVVVTNPTHVAVALKYDPDTMDAPKVVAKGLRLVAERIKRIARENDVPIVERPELARAMYKTVEVGKDIPAEFFEAVAQVLAYLQRLGHDIMSGVVS